MSQNIQFPLKFARTENWGLKKWQECFDQIFRIQNDKIKKNGFGNNRISFSRGYIISHLAQDLGVLAEHIREVNKIELRTKSLPAIFAWICAFANEFNLDLEKVIYKKYPGYCKYCGRSVECDDAWWTTPQTETGKKPNKRIRKNQTKIDKPTELCGWIMMWESIYGKKYKIGMSLSDIMYKIQEEHAEVLEELDKIGSKSKAATPGLKSELADLVSWIFALIYKLETYGYLKREELPEGLTIKFEKGCKKCGKENKPNCTCTIPWL